MRDKIKNVYKNQWFYLFHALIIMLILFPYLDPEYTLHHHPQPLLLLNSAVILIIIYTVSPTKRYFTLGLIFGLPALVCFWVEDMSNNSLVILGSILAMYLYAIWMTIRFLLKSNEFSMDQVFGGASVYILIGLTWTIAFQGIEIFKPGSFVTDDPSNVENILSWSDFIYYSFTTLTTLGYGDITPLHPAARSLAILEAITGVIFVPVIISGILSIVITSTLHKKHHQSP
ncbi:MAG: potassium channel family protein [Chlamydiota bacterium]